MLYAIDTTTADDAAMFAAVDQLDAAGAAVWVEGRTDAGGIEINVAGLTAGSLRFRAGGSPGLS